MDGRGRQRGDREGEKRGDGKEDKHRHSFTGKLDPLRERRERGREKRGDGKWESCDIKEKHLRRTNSTAWWLTRPPAATHRGRGDVRSIENREREKNRSNAPKFGGTKADREDERWGRKGG